VFCAHDLQLVLGDIIWQVGEKQLVFHNTLPLAKSVRPPSYLSLEMRQAHIDEPRWSSH
jgi:hypothetical protein